MSLLKEDGLEWLNSYKVSTNTIVELSCTSDHDLAPPCVFNVFSAGVSPRLTVSVRYSRSLRSVCVLT